MQRTHRFCLIVILLGCVLTGLSLAQWSDQAGDNLCLADQAGDQVLPKIAVTVDDGCYIGWFNNNSGNYDVYLQRLDTDGNEMWGHNGIEISGHPQESYITDWDLMTDSAGNAVLVFADNRNGTGFDIVAYRISPAGDFLWGADGISVTSNSDFEPSPCVTETLGGEFMVAWGRSLPSGDGKIYLQKISAAGEIGFAQGGIPIAGSAGKSAGFPDAIPDQTGGIIVSWVEDLSLYSTPRYLYCESFNADGTSAWGGRVTIFDLWSLPMGYAPKLESDGFGGAVFVWHYSAPNLYTSAVQRVTHAGTITLPHNGVTVSTSMTHHHISPTMSFDPDSGDFFLFWDERTSAQSQWGLYCQRISAAGDRLWGSSGKMLQPVTSLYKNTFRSVICGDGAIVFYIDEPALNQDRVVGMRVDENGDSEWDPALIEISTAPSSKSRLPIAMTDSGMSILVWEDDRDGTQDIYTQNIFPNSDLGQTDTGGLDDLFSPTSWLGQNQPNPFTDMTRIQLQSDISATGGLLQIFDPSGRRVRQFEFGPTSPGGNQIQWDGSDEFGRALPSGIYHYSLITQSGQVESRQAVLLR